MSGCQLMGIAILIFLAGCSAQKIPSGPLAEAVDKPCESPLDERNFPEPEGTFSSLASMMNYRQQVCALPEQERQGLLNIYQEGASDQAAIARLILTSCVPDGPSGLFAQSLSAAREQRDAPPGFFAFLELLETQQQAYLSLEARMRTTEQQLEERLRTTEQQLEETIEGIRAIETEMDADVDNAQGDNPND